MFMTVILTIMCFMAFVIKQYYDNTYVGYNYYLKVPSDQDITLEQWQSGSYIITGRQYSFDVYNEKGKSKTIRFSINDNQGEITEEDLLQPHTYVLVNTSKNRVIYWNRVTAEEIPKEVLRIIEASSD